MDGAWPDWRVSEETVGELAWYVAAEEPPSLVIGADLRGTWRTRGDGRSRAGELYDLLLDRNIRYAAEPFAPERVAPDGAVQQRIRTPEEVLRGVGSCLDVSLLYAGMAMVANLRPLLAVRLDGEQSHALVLLDLQAPLSEQMTAGPDYWQARDDLPGAHVHTPVWDDRGAADPRALDLDGRWLAVDVVAATLDQRPGRTDFERACRHYRPLPQGHWSLVDVAAGLAGHQPYEPPAGVAYPIHTQLPELRQFRDYPGRVALRDELVRRMRKARTVVLQGPGGRGKSMLAERLAWGADNGCGWVLNATNVPTLRASLAAAERAERGLPEEAGDRAERLDATELTQYALAALERLRTSSSPWVVVLDNCDVPPDTEGLAALLPHPTADGQVVIVTTREPRWLDACAEPGCVGRTIPALEEADLALIGLPPEAAGTRLAENPLTAETFARLGSGLSTLSEHDLDGDPHELVWTLVRTRLTAGSDPVHLAELLAWSPPEPLDVALAPAGKTAAENAAAAEALADLRFVARTVRQSAEPVFVDDPTDGGPPPVVQMHRLYAEAIRRAMWRSGVDDVVRTLSAITTTDWGRANLVSAADLSLLTALERDHAPRVADESSDDRGIGLIWQGLGHVRERRGPVPNSEPHFTVALERLDGAVDPYAVAEAEIGLARVVYQQQRRPEYEPAQDRIRRARALLEGMPEQDARQLREQGNALFWLIEQRLAGEKDLADRLDRLLTVREELWLSFERRMQLWDGDGGQGVVRTSPPAEAGLGPERAYFNLGGVHVAIAKARHGSGDRSTAADDLATSDAIYRNVAELRSLRYGGRPHPHHAACVNGRAIVAYHRAAMIGDRDRFPEAYRFAVSALQERSEVARAGTTDRRGVMDDRDVAKTTELLFKIAAAGATSTCEDVGSGLSHVQDLIAKAARELRGWQG